MTTPTPTTPDIEAVKAQLTLICKNEACGCLAVRALATISALQTRVRELEAPNTTVVQHHHVTYGRAAPELEAQLAAAQAEVARERDRADKFMWQVRDTCTRAEKAEAQLATLRAAITTILCRCEAMEDEASDNLAGDGNTEHTLGFWRGQKMAAKSIRNHLADMTRNLDQPEGEGKGCHPSHDTRISDASSYDEICNNCGATDGIGTWGKLAEPCPSAATQPEGEGKDEPTDADLKPFGYAPGYYIGGCRDCSREQKLDGRMMAKRAWRCREHAVAAYTKPTQPEPDADPLVAQVRKEAVMLREIAQSHARGIDWQANLTAAAECFEALAARGLEVRKVGEGAA